MRSNKRPPSSSDTTSTETMCSCCAMDGYRPFCITTCDRTCVRPVITSCTITSSCQHHPSRLLLRSLSSLQRTFRITLPVAFAIDSIACDSLVRVRGPKAHWLTDLPTSSEPCRQACDHAKLALPIVGVGARRVSVDRVIIGVRAVQATIEAQVGCRTVAHVGQFSVEERSLRE